MHQKKTKASWHLRFPDQRFTQIGFTLVEMIVTISLLVLAAGIAGRMIIYGIEAFNSVRHNEEAVANLRTATGALQRDLRMIQSASSITYADDDSISFTSIRTSSVNFAYRNGAICRNQGALLKNVTAFELLYYDANGNELVRPVTIRSQIWRIDYTFTFNAQNQPVTMYGTIAPRNF